mgnify:CR=1 FL=1
MGFKTVHCKDVKSEKVEGKDYKGVTVRWLITRDDGAENFAMRFFEVEPGGQTELHSHDWEHEVFILKGKGLVVCGDVNSEVTHGCAVFIPASIKHCFKNPEDEKLGFLCLIPYKK